MDDLLISWFISSFVLLNSSQIGFLFEKWRLEVAAQFKTFFSRMFCENLDDFLHVIEGM